MDKRRELRRNFAFMGCDPSELVLSTSFDLCLAHGLSPEDFVDHWSAFNITHGNAVLNVDNLLLMERKELARLKRKTPASNERSWQDEAPPPQQPDDTPKQQSSAQKGNKRLRSPDEPESVEPSPAQTLVTEELPEISYTDRTDSGQVLLSFGPSEVSRGKDQDVHVKLFERQGNWHAPEKFSYLYNTQNRLGATISKFVETLGQAIFKKNFLNKPAMFGVSTMTDMTVYGRIKPECDDKSRLNGNAVRLEGSREYNNGRNITLNISKTKSFSLIPGQVVAVHGSNVYGNSFIPQEFYDNATADFSPEAPKWQDNMQIIVAAGPYTMHNNLLYEPLQDLLKYVVEAKPDVLILMGPFVDCTQANISLVEDTTYELQFENLLESIMECLKGLQTRVVLVPSQNDAHHQPVYPTPSFEIKQKYSNLLCASDPCMLDVSGLIIGVTTVDVLFHLTRQEISRKPIVTDRMSRLASHIIKQRCFYPLFPPSNGVNIDYELFLNNCLMEVTPHILILPSTLRHCIKNVNQCLVINPERLVKTCVGGTFAVINVAPASETGTMVEHISCQIRKI